MPLSKALTCMAVVGSLVAAHAALADVIVSPTAATASSTLDGTSINDTINQSGLSTTFTSGVTDFDTYMAGVPTHTINFSGAEWFSDEDVTSATVIYDLGSTLSISRFALWNEDSSGIGSFDLLVSTNGTNYTSVLTGVSPFNGPEGVDYPAQIFALGTQSARFVRLDVSGCPQPEAQDPDILNACAIGEVAFAQVLTTPPPTGTPVPGALLLLLTGLAGAGAVRLRGRDC